MEGTAGSPDQEHLPAAGHFFTQKNDPDKKMTAPNEHWPCG